MGDSKPLSQALQQAIADLPGVNPGWGLLRFTILGSLFLTFVFTAWWVSHPLGFFAASILAGIFYGFWLICTHDMAHQTLTGWRWFDTIAPRLMSWPMVWPYGVYAQLHRLHHGWNGINLQDPERVQWTVEEYQQANQLQQWYVRHQWWIDIFILGGIGLIVKTFLHGLRCQSLLPRLRRELWGDSLGILLFHSLFLAIVISQGEFWRYLLFWLLLERSIGIIVQVRDHLEHYALWGQSENHQLTQLYTCRNLQTLPIVGWLMGGLNYHAVHHAFPHIPFDQLPAAFHKIQAVLKQYQLPEMVLEPGYIRQTFYYSYHPSLISTETSNQANGRKEMVEV